MYYENRNKHFLVNGATKESDNSLKQRFQVEIFFKIQTYVDTVVNSLKLCALGVLIDPNSTSMLFKILVLHNFD